MKDSGHDFFLTALEVQQNTSFVFSYFQPFSFSYQLMFSCCIYNTYTKCICLQHFAVVERSKQHLDVSCFLHQWLYMLQYFCTGVIVLHRSLQWCITVWKAIHVDFLGAAGTGRALNLCMGIKPALKWHTPRVSQMHKKLSAR